MNSESYTYRLKSLVSKERSLPYPSPFNDEEELTAPLLLNTSNSLSTFNTSHSSTGTPTLVFEEGEEDTFHGSKQPVGRRQSCYAVGLLFLAALILLSPLLSLLKTKWLGNQITTLFPPSLDRHSCGCGMDKDKFCDVYGSEANLQLSHIYEGTNIRVDKALKTALSGGSLVIGVMGGSVSACHGVAADPSGYSSGCYVNQVARWLNESLPVKDGHTIHNGAIGGMDSRCVSHTIFYFDNSSCRLAFTPFAE
jgi:hypothetical protein